MLEERSVEAEKKLLEKNPSDPIYFD